ncbi:MAG: hypothetical protein H8E53_03640, partial [Planctomycetes bacterium]|nr:hypothetical protein [Planctomycetota bacterium]
MKPSHKPRHFIAVIILSIVAGGYGYLAIHDTRLDASQVRLATVAMKDHNPSLYPHDSVFGDSGLWRGHSPLFLGAMKMVLAPAGYEDPTLPFRILSPVVTLVFLLGMYVLIYRQCLNWSVSVFIAILSTTVTSAPGRVSWGMGPVAMVTPTGVCLAVLPLLVLAFLRSWDYHKHPARASKRGLWWLLGVFTCVGLLGNIELGMSMNTALGFLFNLGQTNVLKNNRMLEPLVTEVLPLPRKLHQRAARLGNLDEVEVLFPGLKAFLDATEQEIPRPTAKGKRRTHYSGKKKRHTVKTQITV